MKHTGSDEVGGDLNSCLNILYVSCKQLYPKIYEFSGIKELYTLIAKISYNKQNPETKVVFSHEQCQGNQVV